MTIKDDNRLDDLIRRKLEQFVPEPPPGMWEKVRNGIAFKEPGNRQIRIRWIAAAAVLLVAFVTGWLLRPIREDSSGSGPARSHVSKTLPEIAGMGMDTEREPGADPGTLPYAGNLGATAKASAKKDQKTDSFGNFAGYSADRNVAMLPEIKPLPGRVTGGWPGPDSETLAKVNHNKTIHPVFRDEVLAVALPVGTGQTQKDSWEIGVHLSPAYSSYTSRHSAEYARKMAPSDNQSGSSLGAGISLRFPSKGKWRIESGLYYSQTGNQSGTTGPGDRNDLIAGNLVKTYSSAVIVDNGRYSMNSLAGVIKFSKIPINNRFFTYSESAINLNTAVAASGEFSQVFEIMEIPFNLRYRILHDKIGIELIGGISTGLIIGNHVYVDNPTGRMKVGTTDDISVINLSGLAGIGATYTIGRNISLSVEPKASYFINSINHSGDVRFHPWRVGFYSGLTYHF
jgi:hypothetical protein